MSKKKAKIDRSDYQRAKEAVLAILVLHVVNSTKGNAIYENLLGELLPNLNSELSSYQNLLAEALNRDKTVILQKDEAKEILINSMDEVADVIDKNANGSISFIIDAGFKTQGGNTPKTPLLPPIILKLKSNGEIAQLAYSVDFAAGNVVRNVEYEYEGADKIVVQGHYFSKKKGILLDIPRDKEVKFRFRTIGADKEVSEWSEVYIVPVL